MIDSGIDGGAKVETALRNPADDPGLGGQRHEVEQLLFGGNRGNAFGHADAEIDHAAHRQFQSAAPRNDLAVVQRHRHIAIGRRPQFTGERAVVAGGIGLDMVFRLGNDDAIDQYARNFDMPRIERTGGGDAFDLGDDEALAVLGGRCQCQVVEGQRLLFHRDVAVAVGGGAADDRDIDRKRLVEQPLLAVDLHQPHQLFGGACIELAATIGRVDEGTETDLGKKPGLASRNLAKQMRYASERQIVGLDVVVDGHPGQLRHQAKVSADQTLDQAGMRQTIEAAVAAVARRGCEHQR